MYQGRKLIPYQDALRAIGEWLDERIASSICLLEADDGFFVRYRLKLTEPSSSLIHFSDEALVSRQAVLQARRARWRSRDGQQSGSRPYQDFFRALGYELDEGKARGLVLGELEERIVVTYHTIDSVHGHVARKHMIVVDSVEWQTVLHDAYARRRSKNQHGGLNLRLLGLRNRR